MGAFAPRRVRKPTRRSSRRREPPAMFPTVARATAGNVIAARRDFRGRLERRNASRAGCGSTRLCTRGVARAKTGNVAATLRQAQGRLFRSRLERRKPIPLFG